MTRLVREVCAERGTGTIADLLRLEASDPEKYLERAICNYHLGEILLLEMYELLGRDSLATTMRELYLQAEATNWTEPVTEDQIYRAFRANVPMGKSAAFNALYDRYHGGSFEGMLLSSDCVPLNEKRICHPV